MRNSPASGVTGLAILLGCFVAHVVAAPTAWASEPPARTDAPVRPDPHDDMRVEVSAAAVVLTQLPAAGAGHTLVGGGVSASYAFVPHRWAAEVVVHALVSDSVTSYPVDLLLKRELPLGRVVHPFVTLGPTIVPELRSGHGATFIFGGAASAGIDFWLAEHVGVVVEGNANLLAHHGALLELGAILGPVARF